VDFNLNFMNMLNDDKKTFYELINNPTFKNTLNNLKISALELLKPTNYANWVEEGAGKPYKFFSDEIALMKGSKSLSPEGEPSNQRQFYKLALHIYNQVVQPFDYYLNDKLRPENAFSTSGLRINIDMPKFLNALHNTYYNNDKGLAKIASIEGINPTAKLKYATNKIKSFMENWLGDKDNQELISNIISKYNLKSKDFTPTGIKGEWLEKPREKTS
ncbi:hypothetical protein, partial [Mycoplasmopsis primatum]|uniref:hypothetical protein n=1 Tax=Mycoplasmopsis primatum TaxID=55604 RepID=UPI00055D8FB5